MSAVTENKREINTLIYNIGTLVSGDIDKPLLNNDALLIKGKFIKQIGSYEQFKDLEIDMKIDIQGMTLCPGLIDSHTHPVISDWSPRIKISGWMEGMLHAGVTTIISQGENMFPGKPNDPAGVKAIAILGRKAYMLYRPGGLKVHCGALILEDGLTPDDIRDVAKEGVWLMAEVGLGGLKDFNKIVPLVNAAKEQGFKIPVHFGPASFPGVCGLSTDDIIKLNPDVVAHFNGGPTAYPFPEMKRTMEGTTSFLELICNGNPRALNNAIELARESNQLRRIIVGTDTPTGMGILPLGIIRLLAQISSLNRIPAATSMCMATGNTAQAFALNTGLIKPGREADLIVIDAPSGSEGKTALEAIELGDTVFMGMVMVDGIVITRTPKRALNTIKKVLINGEEEPPKTIDDIAF